MALRSEKIHFVVRNMSDSDGMCPTCTQCGKGPAKREWYCSRCKKSLVTCKMCWGKYLMFGRCEDC